MARIYSLFHDTYHWEDSMKRGFGDILMLLVKLGFLVALTYAASDLPEDKKTLNNATTPQPTVPTNDY